jgi:large subunit ribosomal protein L31e
MADEKKEVLFERVMTIPMRPIFDKPTVQRTPAAVKHVKNFVAQHTHTTAKDIWIDRELNMLIWHRSVRKPPKSIKVRVIKWDDQTVEVDLPEE